MRKKDKGGGMMERLTNSDKEIPSLIDNAKYWLQVYFKLKEIEDLEEQGLLLRFPCKVGTTVYEVSANTDDCYECMFFEKGCYCDDWCGNKNVKDKDGENLVINPQYSDYPLCENHFWQVITYEMKDVDMIYRNMYLFGRTIFFTKAEAEQKLKEMESDCNDKN